MLNLKGNHTNPFLTKTFSIEDEEVKLEEEYIELSQELDDDYIERTLQSHGNLLINFYSYVLYTVVKNQLDLSKDSPK